MATKRIPYGISDFRLLSGEDFYYVDKTRFIGEIEKCPNFLFLIRPRRFGKSLWLSMLLDVGVVLRHGDEGQVRGAVRKVLHWQPPNA